MARKPMSPTEHSGEMQDLALDTFEVEAAVLGSILRYGLLASADAEYRPLLAGVIEQLTPELFATAKHRIVLEAIRKTQADGIPPDYHTIRSHISYDEASSIYLLNLEDGSPHVTALDGYITRLREGAARRALVATCIEGAWHGARGDDVSVVVATVDANLHAIQETERSTCLSAEATMLDYAADMEQLRKGSDTCSVPTGFYRLDQMIGGLPRGDMTILAARPKVGKTSLALAIVRRLSETGRPVIYFSLEMTRRQISNRIVSALTGIPVARLAHATVYRDEERMFAETLSEIAAWPLHIDDRSAATVPELRAQIARIESTKRAPDVVVVDHLGYLRAEGSRSGYESMTRISRGLRALAKDTDVALLAISQMGRAIEHREASEREPRLSDLRESGALEEDASNVMFLIRPQGERDQDVSATLIVAAQRNGPTGRIELTFHARASTFTEKDEGERDDEQRSFSV